MLYFRLLRGKGGGGGGGGKGVAKSLKEIFTVDIQPHIEGFSEIMLHCDHGKEFYNTDVASVVDGLRIHLSSFHSDYKAAVVERVIRKRTFSKSCGNEKRKVDIADRASC